MADSEDVISLPGHQEPRHEAYHGPQYPPQAPPLVPVTQSSDVLAADIKRRDILQNQATEWYK